MKSFSITDVGRKRAENQDAVFCDENTIGSLPNLFIVADGMGGHNAGDYASKLCVEAVSESVRSSQKRTPVSILEEAIQGANKKIWESAGQNPSFYGMGTTMVASVIINSTLYIANIGDSRLYLLRDGCKQITEDHSYVEEMVKSGKIQKEDVKTHPRKNVITRALGIGTTVLADYFELELNEGDYVLMCSDGLTNMLEDGMIAEIIRKNQEDIRKSAIELVDKANEFGGKDNISVILIKV